ncbi:IS5 family transposase [Thiolapillus sp.]|uniref:IS5 family transposase n=3 Tax=Thiolapillus sp. TaxID=2017437 RepID=UPI003AF4F73E
MKQTTSSITHKKVTTKREAFLNEMERVVPWSRLLKLIEPYYPKAGNGRPPMPMETMLRIYFLQQWYSLSDPAAEEVLYDIEIMRRFAQLELFDDAIPDETTILKFRHMIERHTLSEAIFADINNHLVEKGIRVSQGSMVDATIIQTASSTKNKDKKRDAEMHSTRKNNQYYFGMKIHIGTDVNSNAIHSATVTPANTADITELPKLLRERDRVVFADAGYTSDSYKRGARALGMSWKVNDKRKVGKEMSASQKKQNKKNSSVRARIEHCFRVIKCQFGYQKARYKGLEKNRVQVFTLLGLVNLYMLRGRLEG